MPPFCSGGCLSFLDKALLILIEVYFYNFSGGWICMGSVVKKRRKKIRKHKYRKLKKKMRHKNK